MKRLGLLLVTLITISQLSAMETAAHAKSALLGIPVPEKRADAFINGRALTIRSQNVLESCAQKLKLAEKWELEAATAIQQLSSKITAIREPETDFIRITATGKDAAESAELLNGVLDAAIANFSKHAIEREQRRLEALDDEIQKQADVVLDQRKALTVLTQQYGIPYFDQHGNTAGNDQMAIYRKTRFSYEQQSQELNTLKIKTEQILNTSESDFIRLAPGLDLPVNRVSELHERHQEIQKAIKLLQDKGLGKDHPEVRALSTAKNDALNDVKEEVTALKESFKKRLSLKEKQVTQLAESASIKRSDCIDLSMQQHNYTQAVTAYEAARDLLREMRNDQQRSRIELAMPINYEVYHLP